MLLLLSKDPAKLQKGGSCAKGQPRRTIALSVVATLDLSSTCFFSQIAGLLVLTPPPSFWSLRLFSPHPAWLSSLPITVSLCSWRTKVRDRDDTDEDSLSGQCSGQRGVFFPGCRICWTAQTLRNVNGGRLAGKATGSLCRDVCSKGFSGPWKWIHCQDGQQSARLALFFSSGHVHPGRCALCSMCGAACDVLQKIEVSAQDSHCTQFFLLSKDRAAADPGHESGPALSKFVGQRECRHRAVTEPVPRSPSLPKAGPWGNPNLTDDTGTLHQKERMCHMTSLMAMAFAWVLYDMVMNIVFLNALTKDRYTFL